MTPAQAEWLSLARADGRLPREWPAGRRGKHDRSRRVDLRIIQGCIREGWVAVRSRLIITEAGRTALARLRQQAARAAERSREVWGTAD